METEEEIKKAGQLRRESVTCRNTDDLLSEKESFLVRSLVGFQQLLGTAWGQSTYMGATYMGATCMAATRVGATRMGASAGQLCGG